MTAKDIKQKLLSFGNPEKAEHSKYFFKTGKGQYGEGDKFIGCTTPEMRSVAKTGKNLPLAELKLLLNDDMHECRVCALVILTEQFEKVDENRRKEIVDFYLEHTHRINNWDLVDISAYKILGEFLVDKNRAILYLLADSDLLWDQRIAMISTMAFIRRSDFEDVIRLSEIFLTHKHDLMHKASGWMLREAGKRDEKILINFLDKHHKKMPRTMLRYAIEKLTPEQKKHYMQKD